MEPFGALLFEICDALRDLVPFVQFKKREKYPGRSVTKINTPPWVGSRFLNCANGTKSCNAPIFSLGRSKRRLIPF